MRKNKEDKNYETKDMNPTRPGASKGGFNVNSPANRLAREQSPAPAEKASEEKADEDCGCDS